MKRRNELIRTLIALLGVVLIYALLVTVLYPALIALILSGNTQQVFARASHCDTDGALWFNWWFAYARTHGLPLLYTRHLSYPVGENLMLTCGNFIVLAALHPIAMLRGAVCAFNSGVFVVLVANCVAGYLLIREATGRARWSLIGGAMIGMNSYVLLEIRSGRLEQGLICGLVLSFLFLLRTIRTCRWRDALGIALCFAFTSLASWHYGIMLGLFVGLLLAVLLIRKQWRSAGLVVAGMCVGSLLLLPAVIPLLHALQGGYAWDVSGGGRQALDPQLLTLMTNASFEPWLYAFSGDRKHIALGIPVLLVIFSGLIAPVRRKQWLWYLVCVVALILSVGPGREIRLPFYYVVKHIPFVRRLIWPARFLAFFYCGLAVILTAAAAQLWRQTHGVFRRLALVVGVGLLTWLQYAVVNDQYHRMRPQTVNIPSVYLALAGKTSGAILELPLDSDMLYAQSFHQYPTSVGSIAFPAVLVPEDRRQVLAELAFGEDLKMLPSRDSIETIRGLGFRYLIIHVGRVKMQPGLETWRERRRRLDALLGEPLRCDAGKNGHDLLYTIDDRDDG